MPPVPPAPRGPASRSVRPRRLPRRLVQLYLGLWLYGLACAMFVRARLGLDPWDVLHQGISERVGLAIGTVTIVMSAVVLLFWIPLRQRPGLGTISNAVLVGVSVNVSLELLPAHAPLWVRWGELLGGIVALGVATGMYIGANLGPGPRDGLMTGLARRTGRSIRLVRTGLELTVLVVGWLLGGTVGVGTVLFALAIGPLTQFFLPLFDVREPGRAAATRPPRRRGRARWRAGRSPSRTPGAGRRSSAAGRRATRR
ncbi:Uncharacterized membrane protein YczE [Jatrophihabitans endophyticus]|uniref:Uncharacterized membrane protein YczE n=1 Tax=Jatrophihabitans endophyticus TaxID=1206085 RepID=A0A1M5E7J7_9ACTN|nr:Uncharacterized membrane protein YczE [Jatrophihabitans endophyticus]